MKFVVFFIVFLTGNFLYASEEDTSSVDTNYTLYDHHSYGRRDSSIRFVVTEPENTKRKKSDDWITGPVNDGPIGIGSNYDSVHNVNPKVAGFISVCFLAFVLYIVLRVRRSLKKDKRNRRTD